MGSRRLGGCLAAKESSILWLSFMATFGLLWLKKFAITVDGELSALMTARSEIKVDDCMVVTWDEEREIVPAWKWCLDESPK